MTIKVLTDKGVSNREAARLLGVSEGTVRYHRRRMAAGVVDGRTQQQPVAAFWREAIEAYLEARDEPSPSNRMLKNPDRIRPTLSTQKTCTTVFSRQLRILTGFG